MSAIPSILLLLGSALAGILAVYLITAPPPGDSVSRRPTLLFSLGFLGLEMVILWHWFAIAFPIIAWAFFIGDNQHWFWEASTPIALFAAAFITSGAALRILLGLVDRRYFQIAKRLNLTAFGVAVLFWSALYGPKMFDAIVLRLARLIS